MPVGIGLSGDVTEVVIADLHKYPPKPPPPVFSFEIGPWGELPNSSLPMLTGRSVTWRLGPADNSEASATIDSTQPQAKLIQEVISALGVRINGRLYYRGLIGATAHTFGPDSHSVQFASADMRALITSRRFIFMPGDDEIVVGFDAAQLGWAAIDATQSDLNHPGGQLGIIKGSVPTTFDTTLSLPDGTGLGAFIDTLAQSSPGFDWDLTPVDGTVEYSYDVWYPQRGTDRQTVLDYELPPPGSATGGGRIASGTRNVDPGAYANAIRASAGTLTPVKLDSAAINIADPASLVDPTIPRLEALVTSSDITTAPALAAWAAGQLAASQTLTPSYTVTLPPDSWGGPEDFWLGDPVIVRVKSGPLNVVESLRVVEIALTLDDQSDAATVAVTLGAPRPSRRWLLRRIDQRLKALETR